MGQYLLIPFLVGWTSIYQKFWASLGTRVLTHPHIYIYYIYITKFVCLVRTPHVCLTPVFFVFSIFSQWRCSPPWLAAGSRRWWCKPSRSPRRTSSPRSGRAPTCLDGKKNRFGMRWFVRLCCDWRMYWKVMKSLDVDWCLLMFLGVCWCLGNIKWSFGYESTQSCRIPFANQAVTMRRCANSLNQLTAHW